MKLSYLNPQSLIRKSIAIVRSATIRTSISYRLPEDPIKFLIVSEPRSGSNLLCGIINSHLQVLCFYEMFHRDAIYYGPLNTSRYDFGAMTERDLDPVGFLSKIYSPLHGYRAVGFKMFNGHNNTVLSALIKSTKIKKIFLRRKAALHAFTSLEIARKTDNYIQMAEGNIVSPQRTKINLNIQSFMDYVEARNVFYEWVLKMLGSQCFIDIDYVDIVKHNKNFHSIPAFIGVDESTSLKDITMKQNSENLQDRIINFEEVRNSIIGTKYEKYLEEDLL